MKTIKILVVALLFFVKPAFAIDYLFAANENAAEQIIAEGVLIDIYKAAGINIRVLRLPAVKATDMAVKRQVDGEVARVYSYGATHPSLIRVEPAYFFLSTVGYAKKSFPKTLRSKEDLLPFTVGIVKGIQHATTATENHSRVMTTNTYEDLYALLETDSIQIALDTGYNGKFLLNKLGYTDLAAKGTIGVFGLFNYVTDNNKKLIPIISATIIRLQQSGEMNKIIRKHEMAFAKASQN